MTIVEKIQDYAKKKYDRTKVRVKRPYFFAADAAQEGVRFASPVAAVLTLGADPNAGLLERIVHGPIDAAKALYDVGAAYAHNTGFRDAMNGGVMHGLEVMGNAAQNVAAHPVEAAEAGLIVYLGGRLLAAGIKAMKDYKIDQQVQYAKRG